MKLLDVKNLLDCEVLSGADKLDIEIKFCLSSDMMSDVLTYAKPGALLITGLTNAQSVRTAEIADLVSILYVRGKKPDKQTIKLAEELKIPLLSTKLGMFVTCSSLQIAGLDGIC
jgi:predicted transcriptional regulator